MLFTFSVEQDDLLGTLESVLMTARRGNLKLESLQVCNSASEAMVSMRLLAEDADWLALYQSRLQNIIGISNIETAQETSCAEYSEGQAAGTNALAA